MIDSMAFEAAYAERSGTTVEWLRRNGYAVETCDCDYDACEGWKMVRDDTVPITP